MNRERYKGARRRGMQRAVYFKHPRAASLSYSSLFFLVVCVNPTASSLVYRKALAIVRCWARSGTQSSLGETSLGGDLSHCDLRPDKRLHENDHSHGHHPRSLPLRRPRFFLFLILELGLQDMDPDNRITITVCGDGGCGTPP